MAHLKTLAASAAMIAAMMQPELGRAQNKPVPKPPMPAFAAVKDIPLIPRELFFDNPEVSGSQLSPDGKYISFLKAYNGIMNIWVKAIDEPFTKARPLTASEEPMGGYFWTYDGKYILFGEAKGGNENDNIYAVDPMGKADPKTGVPVARNLTPNDKVKAEIFAVSKKNPDILWVGLNDRDAKWHDLYKLEISTGKLTMLEQNNDRLSAWIFDWDENIRLAFRSPEDGSSELLRKNADGTYTKIYDCAVLESFSPLNFTKDNSKIYMETNKGNVDLSKLVLLDPKTMVVTDVESDPLNKVDFGSVQFSDKTHDMILTSYTDSKTRLYFKDKSYEADYKFLQSKFPGMEIAYKNSDNAEKKFLIAPYSDTKMPEVYLFDRITKKLTFQYNPRPKLKEYEQYFGTMDPIVYKSSDGLEIPAYLSLPNGVPAKNLPLVVFPHGGPWSRDGWGFNTFAQWLTNRGYAVLQINFRGSTGYGKKFLNAGNKQWGMLMQDDITWGVKELVSKGIADPARVGIMGGSYGGYATLAGLAFTPELYAAGVDIVGPSNLITLLNSIPAYWEAGRKQFTERMGDPSTPEGKALLEKQSPLNSAAKIKAPLMIIQGANDPRVKKAESDQIAIALRDMNRNVVYLCAPDEGHGYHKPVNNLAAMGSAEVFLGKALKARYQESMKPDAAKRLKEITVDVSTLTLQKKVEVTAMKELPQPTSDLAAANYNYTVTIEMQGQKIPMAMVRTISEANNMWVVNDKVSSPMGDMTDEAVYSKGSLHLVSRKFAQGPDVTNYAFEKDKFTSKKGDKTNTTTVAGAYIVDGGGSDMIIARMPLKEGFETGFYVADQEGKTSLNKLKVSGTENVNGAMCYKCEMISAEDPTEVVTYYIGTTDKLTHKAVFPLTGVPGAKMTLELKK
jgi:dipeptidyl aminopeptidase/acylaminoacyl peptidase